MKSNLIKTVICATIVFGTIFGENTPWAANVVDGTVFYDGNPVQGAKLYVHKVGEQGTSPGTTNASGYYRIKGLAVGEYVLTCYPPSLLQYNPVPEQAVVFAADPTTVTININLEISPFYEEHTFNAITGTITFNGAPVNEVDINVIDESNKIAGDATTDMNGAYVVEQLSVGVGYSLKCYPPSRFAIPPFRSIVFEDAVTTSIQNYELELGSILDQRNGTNTIIGTVTHNGLGIEGVNIYLNNGPEIWRIGETDAAGQFNLDFVESGIDFELSCLPPQRYSTPYAVSVRFDSENTTQTVEFVLNQLYLPAGIALQGFVKDVNDTPVNDVFIEVLSANNAAQIAYTDTEADGSYIIRDLPAGTFDVLCLPSDPTVYSSLLPAEYVPYLALFAKQNKVQPSTQTLAMDMPGTTYTINFTLTEGCKISGTVYQPDGTTPLPNVYLILTTPEGNHRASTTTNVDGIFSINQLETGVYDLVCELMISGLSQPLVSGYIQPTTRTVTLSSPGEVSLQNFTLSEGGAIEGHVYQAGGTMGFDDLWVSAHSIEEGKSYHGTTQSDGSYTIAGLKTGVYNVSPSEPGHDFITIKDVAVTAGETTSGIDFIAQSAFISGVVEVTAGGMPVGDALVTAHAQGTNKFLRTAISTSTGSFIIEALPAGVYDLYAGAEGYIAQKKLSITVPDNGISGINFIAETGKITGLVKYDSINIAGAKVTAVPYGASKDARQFSYGLPSGQTDDNGYYEIPCLPNGSYLLFVEKNGYVTTFLDQLVVVDNGATTANVDFSFAGNNPGSISGSILEQATSMPITDGVVSLKKDDATSFTLGTVVNAQGEFNFSGLPAGTYTIITNVWDIPNYVQQRSDSITLSSAQNITGVNFSLIRETGEITGVIKDSNDYPLANARVTAFSPALGYYNIRYSDANGYYELEPLGAAADYIVEVRKEGYQDNQQSTITVVQNQSTNDVNFTLTAE